MGEMATVKNADNIPVYLARPDNETKGAVLVIHEVWGLTDHIKSVADRLAGERYVAMAPDFLAGGGIDLGDTSDLQAGLFDPERRNAMQPKLREMMAPMQNPEFGAQVAAQAKTCFDDLYGLPEAKMKVAVIGFCFGGTYAFTLATQEPRLKLALPFYGHADFSVEELQQIHCPVRAFYGEDDEALMKQLPELKDKMQQAGVDFTAKTYPYAGHAFFNDSNPYAYNEFAAKDAWQKVLGYLAEM